MPSEARKSFDSNIADIGNLVALHELKGGTAKGRRYGLEALNKSAIVLICAYWEAYCEDIASEALSHILTNIKDPNLLPKKLQQALASELKDNPDQLAIWRLAGDGWRNQIQMRFDNMQESRNRKLNTPKTANIDALFLDTIGLDRVSSSWRWSKRLTIDGARKKLDAFVELRGSIAHRGKLKNSCTKAQVTDYLDFTKNLAARTGGKVNSYVKTSVGLPLW